MEMKPAQILAIFALPADRLLFITNVAGIESITISPVGNGKICSASGSIQSVMMLIGRVADHGEDALLKATLL